MADLINVRVAPPKDGKCAIKIEILDSVSKDGRAASYRVVDAGYVSLKPRVTSNDAD